ncbi:MAG: desulfoferrodoxin [Desulfopila sp.]
MAERYEIYKCDLCGNVVEVLTGAGGALACCGEDMKHLSENTVDAAKEKHVPVVTKSADGLLVNVGSVDHPMTDAHYIEWIEVIAGDTTYTTFLKPDDKPQACFPNLEGDVIVRADCNLHGLWKA